LSFVSVFAQSNPVRVTVLHVNDVYQFTPVDGGTRGGLARLLTLKKQIKAEKIRTQFLRSVAIRFRHRSKPALTKAHR